MDPGHAGETLSLSWPGSASEELEVSEVREIWASALRLLPLQPGPGQAEEDTFFPTEEIEGQPFIAGGKSGEKAE